jgi:hypothetical protein
MPYLEIDPAVTTVPGQTYINPNAGGKVRIGVGVAGSGDTFTVDAVTGNVVANGTLTVTGAQTFTGNQAVTGNQTVGGTLSVTGISTFTALVTLNGGTDTAGSAPVITSLGAVSGTAIQLSDLTRDYMVYLEVTTGGTATSVTIGHTSAASDVTLVSSVTVAAGNLYAFRLPAAWYFKWTGTTTAIANQNAVGC